MLLSLTGCGGFYSFPILEAKQRTGGFDYIPERWWPEGYGDICFDVKAKTNQKVKLCIVQGDVVKEPVFAYAFTGRGSGRVFVLRPAGLDAWEIIAEDEWQGSEKEYFERKYKE